MLRLYLQNKHIAAAAVAEVSIEVSSGDTDAPHRPRLPAKFNRTHPNGVVNPTNLTLTNLTAEAQTSHIIQT